MTMAQKDKKKIGGHSPSSSPTNDTTAVLAFFDKLTRFLVNPFGDSIQRIRRDMTVDRFLTKVLTAEFATRWHNEFGGVPVVPAGTEKIREYLDALRARVTSLLATIRSDKPNGEVLHDLLTLGGEYFSPIIMAIGMPWLLRRNARCIAQCSAAEGPDCSPLAIVAANMIKRRDLQCDVGFECSNDNVHSSGRRCTTLDRLPFVLGNLFCGQSVHDVHRFVDALNKCLFVCTDKTYCRISRPSRELGALAQPSISSERGSAFDPARSAGAAGVSSGTRRAVTQRRLTL